jgi:hypothetical protein
MQQRVGYRSKADSGAASAADLWVHDLGKATESCEEYRTRRPTLRAHLERRLGEDARRQAAAALAAADAAALRALSANTVHAFTARQRKLPSDVFDVTLEVL